MRFLLAAPLVLALASHALADGKFFSPEPDVPPGLPYQRAVLAFQGGSETLILQSRYDLPVDRAVKEFGWVVPVPAVPEMASVPPAAANELFRRLGWETSPTVVSISEFVLPALGWTTLGVILVTLVAVALRIPWLEARRRGLALASLLLVLVTFVLSLGSMTGAADRAAGVEVVVEAQVGVYDAAVVRAEEGGGLHSWLQGRGFGVTDADRAAIDGYVRRGWCFVAARIARDRAEETEEVLSGGFVAPLILRFPVAEPVYPLALTAAAGQETEVVLYLLSKERRGCGDRLETRYADTLHHGDPLESVRRQTDPDGYPLPLAPRGTWLHRFQARLTPAEMAGDLELPPDEGGTVRPREYRW